MATIRPPAGLGTVHTEARRRRAPPAPAAGPSGLTCSWSSPCTSTVEARPLPSRPEMASRDLDTVPRVRAQLAHRPGPHPSAQHSPLCLGQPLPSPWAGQTPAPNVRSGPQKRPLTCGGDTGTRCTRAPALRPVAGVVPGPAAPCGLWRQLAAAALRGLGPAGHTARQTPERLRVGEVGEEPRPGPRQAPRLRPEAPRQWDPGEASPAPHAPGRPRSPTCRLAENWKMAVAGAVNRPEARLRPEPRRKAPWAVGWRDSGERRAAGPGPSAYPPSLKAPTTSSCQPRSGPRWARQRACRVHLHPPGTASGPAGGRGLSSHHGGATLLPDRPRPHPKAWCKVGVWAHRAEP